MLPTAVGDYTGKQYSTRGLTNTLYALITINGSRFRKQRRIRLARKWALDTFELISYLKDSLELRILPRSRHGVKLVSIFVL